MWCCVEEQEGNGVMLLIAKAEKTAEREKDRSDKRRKMNEYIIAPMVFGTWPFYLVDFFFST